jgi:hypothetical protein
MDRQETMNWFNPVQATDIGDLSRKIHNLNYLQYLNSLVLAYL